MTEEIKIGGNGDDTEQAKKILTPEEAKKQRLERYMKDPETFVEITELIIAVRKQEEGLAYLVQGSMSDIERGFARVNQKVINILNAMDIQASMVRKPKITPPGATHNFARKVMGRG